MFSRRKGAKAGRVLFFGISTFFVLFWGVCLAFGNKEEGDIGFVSYSKEKSLVIDQDTEWKKGECVFFGKRKLKIFYNV
jgi:hypothetical protein